MGKDLQVCVDAIKNLRSQINSLRRNAQGHSQEYISDVQPSSLEDALRQRTGGRGQRRCSSATQLRHLGGSRRPSASSVCEKTDQQSTAAKRSTNSEKVDQRSVCGVDEGEEEASTEIMD